MNQYGLILKEGRPELLLQGTPLAGKTFVYNPIDAANLSRKVFLLDVQAEEHLCFFALNIKGEVLGTFEIAHGTASGCMVTPREFLIRLLLVGATQFIAVHNHPSKDPKPSHEDWKFTERLFEASDLIGIELLDHVIVGGENQYSMRENDCTIWKRRK